MLQHCKRLKKLALIDDQPCNLKASWIYLDDRQIYEVHGERAKVGEAVVEVVEVVVEEGMEMARERTDRKRYRKKSMKSSTMQIGTINGGLALFLRIHTLLNLFRGAHSTNPPPMRSSLPL